MKSKILIVAGVIFFSGCAREAIEPKVVFKTPPTQIPKINKEPKINKGSLFRTSGESLFSDKKNLRIGDIIQVLVSETVSSDSKGERKLTKDNSTNLGGGVVTPATAVAESLSSGVSNFTKKINSATSLGFESNSSNSFSGKVSTKHNEQFTTSISAIIEEVYENGNYYIVGTKELLIDGQKQSVIVSGVIRPYDITPENSIDSSQIASLQLIYKKNGTEVDTIQKPFGTAILDKVWPF
jgi:flagellar L-ring protein precursor FlgH